MGLKKVNPIKDKKKSKNQVQVLRLDLLRTILFINFKRVLVIKQCSNYLIWEKNNLNLQLSG